MTCCVVTVGRYTIGLPTSLDRPGNQYRPTLPGIVSVRTGNPGKLQELGMSPHNGHLDATQQGKNRRLHALSLGQGHSVEGGETPLF